MASQEKKNNHQKIWWGKSKPSFHNTNLVRPIEGQCLPGLGMSSDAVDAHHLHGSLSSFCGLMQSNVYLNVVLLYSTRINRTHQTSWVESNPAHRIMQRFVFCYHGSVAIGRTGMVFCPNSLLRWILDNSSAELNRGRLSSASSKWGRVCC